MQNKIILSTIKVTAIMFVIKFLGVIKQSLIASYCGASAESDAYFLATSFVLALCTVLFSPVSISLLSVHTDVLINEGREKSNELINDSLKIFLVLSLLLSIFFIFSSHYIAKFLAPSYQGIQLIALSNYLRVLSIVFIFNCYCLIVNVVLETDKIFVPGKMQSFFQNLFVIISIVVFYKIYGIYSLIISFLFANIVNSIYITFKARYKFYFGLGKVKNIDHIKNILTVSIPLVIGNAIYEINDIVDKQIATQLGHGTVSLLTYGASINEIVTTLIINSVSTILFSHYATWVAENKLSLLEENIKKSIVSLLFFIIPIMIICIVYGDYIVRILYGRGNFNEEFIIKTHRVVFGYALGFIFQVFRANITRVFYAFKDTKIPMINGAIAVLFNICFSLVLSHFFGVMGISIATSLSMLIVTILLLPKLKYYLPNFSIKDIRIECYKFLVSGIVVFVLFSLLKEFISFSYIHFFVICFLIFVGYIITLLILKSNYTAKIINRIYDFVFQYVKENK